MFLFSVKHSHLLTVNTSLDVNNSLISTWYETATVDNSLHVGRTSSLTKLMQYVYVTSFFVSKINFLFELPDRMSLLGSYLLPSFSLLKRLFLF